MGGFLRVLFLLVLAGAGIQPASAQTFAGNIDVPSSGSVLAGQASMWGWAMYNSAPVSGVAISVAGTGFSGNYGDPRTDVCSTYPYLTWVGCNSGSDNVGWDVSVNTASLVQGPNETITLTGSPYGGTTQTTVVVDQGPTVSGTLPVPGMTETITETVTSSVNPQYLTWINGWIAPSLGTEPGCVYSYYPSSNTVVLQNDAGNEWLPGGILGSSDANPSNSQCTINLAASSYSVWGNMGFLSLNITFSPTFTGTQQVYFIAADEWLASSWTYIGAWAAPLTILTTALPSGTPGVSYSQALSAAGGTPPYYWYVNSGSLPYGFSLSSGGQLSGTPTSLGTSNFGVWVSDSGGSGADQSLSLSIIPPSPPTVTISYPTAGAVISGYMVVDALAADNATPINSVRILLDSSTQLANLPGNGATSYQIADGVDTNPLDNPNPPVPQGPNQTITITATDEDSPALTGSASVGSLLIDQPPLTTVSPRSGSGSSQTFTISVDAFAGAQNISLINGWIAPNLGVTHSCVFSFYPSSNTIYLQNDAGSSWLTPGVLQSTDTNPSNSQCTINLDASTYSATGTIGTLSLNLSFTGTFLGTQQVLLIAEDAWLWSNWVDAGSWTVTQPPPTEFTMSAPTISLVTVTPTGARASYNQTFQGINGFSGPVGLSYKLSNGGALPSGLSFSLNTLNVSGPTTITAPITVSAAYGTAAGTYPVSITAVGAGSSGTITQTSSVMVVVTQAPSFNISGLPEIQITNNSNWTEISQIITTTNGFNSPISIAPFQYRDAQGSHALPGPVNLSYGQGSWTPNPITGTVNTYAMVESPSGAPGIYYYDCYASGGSILQQFTIAVNVISTAQSSDFTFTLGSQSVQVTDGGSSFSFPVTLSALNSPNINWPGSFTTIGTPPPGWPPNVNVAVSPSTFSTLPATAIVTITAYSDAPTGTYSPQISVTATNPNTDL